MEKLLMDARQYTGGKMYMTVEIAGNSCTSNLLYNWTSGISNAALQNSTSTFGPSQ